MEYGHWVEEQNRQSCELRNALKACISDVELRFLVDNGMSHYFELFSMKSTAAKADVFYVMSGMWKTSAERFFSWIGGFRPSELLKVIYGLTGFKSEDNICIFVLWTSRVAVELIILELFIKTKKNQQL